MRSFLKYSSIALLTAALLPSDASALSGTWCGNLEIGQMKLPLVFNFSENSKGETSCTIDSPSQGATGIPSEVTFCSGDSIALECKAIGASFTGKIAIQSIDGKFIQRGITLPLALSPDAPLESRRPQTPRPPYPYMEKDTVFTATDGTMLSGTLTLPPEIKGKEVPAVIMVTGSGPQNRDEELFGHKPFAVIADFLSRNGVATLRYDDRGTGKSSGDFLNSTTYTFKDDAQCGIEFLKKIKGIGKIGVLGHSEGGTIAMMLAADRIPDFIISLAGMAESGKKALLRQNSNSLDQSGISGDAKTHTLTLIERLFDIMAEQSRNGISTAIDIDSLVQATHPDVPPMIVSSIKETQKIRTPWFDTFLTINPAKELKKIKCPVLAINGDKDTQVAAEPNLAVISKNMPKAKTHIMPGLNHLLQHCKTGEISEYADISETISPEVLETILSFIHTIK